MIIFKEIMIVFFLNKTFPFSSSMENCNFNRFEGNYFFTLYFLKGKSSQSLCQHKMSKRTLKDYRN